MAMALLPNINQGFNPFFNSLITKLYNRNKIEIKRQQYYIDGVLLGNHLKEASAVASKDPEIKKLIVDAIKQLK